MNAHSLQRCAATDKQFVDGGGVSRPTAVDDHSLNSAGVKNARCAFKNETGRALRSQNK